MYTVGYVAEKIGGRVIGNKEKEVSEICSPEDITKDSIVFIKDNQAFVRDLKSGQEKLLTPPMWERCGYPAWNP